MTKTDIIVIGGGAAGLMAAAGAAVQGCSVTVLEKMARPGRKIMITGNPIRKDIGKATPELKEEAYRFYNLDPKKKTIFVVGGSLGCS